VSERDGRWLERHGLERDPFLDMDAGAGFFARGTRERLLEDLADADGACRPLVTVVGEKGIGRTSLVHALLRRLPQEAQVARATADVFLTVKELLSELARGLGADGDVDRSRTELARAVREQVTAAVDAGECAFLLVDDAGELAGDALEELVSIAELDPEGHRVRVLLFALPGIRDALEAAAGAERVRPLLHELRIERLSLNELRGYLQFRLARAGLEGPSLFREQDVAAIHRESQGVPARINAVASRVLRDMAAGGPRRPLYLAVAAVTVLLALLLLSRLGVDGRPPAEAGPAALPASEPPPPDPAAVSSAAVETPSPRRLDEAEREEAGAWIDDEAAPRIEPFVERAAASTVARPAESAAVAPPTPDQEPAEPDPDETVATESAPAPGSRAWAADHYVLQVLVSSSSERARAFIAARRDPAAYRFYERPRNGALQYVVLQGDHATQDQADGARAAVAEETGLEPFVRSVAEVWRELGDTGSLLAAEAPVGLRAAPSNP
jgi:type II secretory pathway predicted ATPase ExeA